MIPSSNDNDKKVNELVGGEQLVAARSKIEDCFEVSVKDEDKNGKVALCEDGGNLVVRRVEEGKEGYSYLGVSLLNVMNIYFLWIFFFFFVMVLVCVCEDKSLTCCVGCDRLSSLVDSVLLRCRNT